MPSVSHRHQYRMLSFELAVNHCSPKRHDREPGQKKIIADWNLYWAVISMSDSFPPPASTGGQNLIESPPFVVHADTVAQVIVGSVGLIDINLILRKSASSRPSPCVLIRPTTSRTCVRQAFGNTPQSLPCTIA